jgi:hypothetical protein
MPSTLIDRIHAARTDGTGFIVINPGAFTHTSAPCAMRCSASACRSSRCTCPTCMPANRSATTATSATWPSA